MLSAVTVIFQFLCSCKLLFEDFRTLKMILADGRCLNCDYFMKVLATTITKSAAMRQRKSSAPGSSGSAPSSPSNRPGSFMPSRASEATEVTQRPNTLKLDHLPTLQRTQNNMQYLQSRRLTTVESVSCCSINLSKNLNDL